MNHVPELWQNLKLEYKDNVKKKELRKSLIEEENEHEHNIIKPKTAHPDKKSQKLHIVFSHCIIS